MSSRRLALRLAWRDALRHRGRTVLVVLMVGLPVLGATAADVLVRTVQLSPAEAAARQLGTADAELQATSDPPGTAAQVRQLLGPGSAVTTLTSGSVSYAADGGQLTAQVEQLDLSSPLTQGLYRLRSGRAPQRPDEVVLSTSLAHSLHLAPGDTWHVQDPGRTVRVVGTEVDPSSLDDQVVLAAPGALLPSTSSATASVSSPTYLVRTSVPEVDIAAHVGDGFSVTTRDSIEHPPPTSIPADVRSQKVLVGVVAVGLGILQVVLLAGAAFAVGARRQLRDLALVAAAGGEARHVRDVVLAGGVVVGLLGGLGGVALGIPLAAALEPYAEHVSNTLAGSFDLRPLELVGALAIGVIAGLLAAWLPARTAARQDVVLALSGRRGARGTPRALTVGGLIAIALGGIVTARGAAPPISASLVLGGSVVAQLGFVACAPALVGLAARGARWLPLSGRMALRDAARHRARSGPAVAAVMAALAGAVAISTFTVSSSGFQQHTYREAVRLGQVEVSGQGGDGEVSAAALRAVAARLPTRGTATLTASYLPCDVSATGAGPGAQPISACPQVTFGSSSLAPTASSGGAAYATTEVVSVGDAALLRAVLGRTDVAAEQALAAGDLVVLDPASRGDRAQLTTASDPRGLATLPAVHPTLGLPYVPYQLPGAIVSAATARRLGIVGYATGLLIDTTRPPTTAEQARAQAALTAHGGGYLSVERGYQGTTSIVQVALVLVAGLVTLLAVGIATGLAAAEGRADLATLAAVGASPGVRRRLAMAQAAVVAVLGAGLGVLAGLLPAVAVVHARSGWPIVLPWSTIGLGLLAVPALAALLAGVLTRSRLPLIARTS